MGLINEGLRNGLTGDKGLGAIQIICDTLGGVGVSKNVTRQFLLVILLVKIDKNCHIGGLKSAEKVSRII